MFKVHYTTPVKTSLRKLLFLQFINAEKKIKILIGKVSTLNEFLKDVSNEYLRELMIRILDSLYLRSQFFFSLQ